MSRVLRIRHFLLPPLLLVLLAVLTPLLTEPVASAVAANDASSIPVAQNGVLDLSGKALSALGTVELNGEWQFYSQQLWTPGASAPQGHPLLLQVPLSWGEQPAPNDRLSDQGYGTYRLLIRLPANAAQTPLALYMPSVATAYKLWVNGSLLAGNGTVGVDRSTMTPKNYAKLVMLPAGEQELDVVIQVSNFVQRKGGLWSAIRLGSASNIVALREHRVSLEILFAVANLVLSVYHCAIFLFRRRERSSLYLGLFCAAIALRTLLLGDTLLVSWIPSFSWEVAVKLEYLSGAAALSLFPLFVAELYPQESHRRVVQFFLGVGVVFAVPVVLLPARLYTEALVYYEAIAVLAFPYLLHVYIRAIRTRREGAVVGLIAGLVLMASAINDMLYYNEWIRSVELESFGMLLFVFVQTLLIAYRFTSAYRGSELLSAQLQSLNTTLEIKVEERTAALSDSYENLQRLLQSRRSLLSNISHELGTPMTIILGYVSAMLEGVIAEDQHQPYLQSIQNKIVLMERIIKDLFDLAKFEAKQVELNRIAAPADRLLEQAEEFSGLDVRGRNITFRRAPVETPSGTRCHVSADPMRVQQVFGNLLQNAVKYTPSEGTITIGGVWVKAHQTIRYYVADTGKGIPAEALPRVFERFFQAAGGGIGTDASGGEDGAKASEVHTIGGREQASSRGAGSKAAGEKVQRKASGGAGRQNASNSGVGLLPLSGGSGLGLAIAKEIIDLHGGTIGVESKEGAGTVVWFELPAKLMPIDEANTVEGPAKVI